MKFFIIFIVFFALFFYTIHLDGESLKLFNESLFSQDSYSHFLSSAFLYCWQYETLYKAAGVESRTSRIWSFSLTGLCGILKEIFDDKIQKQHFSYKDLVCNFTGSALMFIIWR